MVTVADVYHFIDEFAPFYTAMDFDNVGILVGDNHLMVERVLVSLDITPAVVEEASFLNTQLIISHHPVIFHPLRTLEKSNPVYLLAKYGITAICAHTNLDLAKWGVNTCLAERLRLKNITGIKAYGNTNLHEALLGELDQEYQPLEFAAYVKELLNCSGIKFTCGSKKIKKVGLCSGAGSNLLFESIDHGADAFVTSEVKHHEWMAAAGVKITLVDAGHFNTEDVVIQPLADKLKETFHEIEFIKSRTMIDPIMYL